MARSAAEAGRRRRLGCVAAVISKQRVAGGRTEEAACPLLCSWVRPPAGPRSIRSDGSAAPVLPAIVFTYRPTLASHISSVITNCGMFVMKARFGSVIGQ